MRAWLSVGLVVVLSGCRPSATVQSTTPVANLRVYQGLVVRGTGRGHRRGGRLGRVLERSAAAAIRNRCAMDVRTSREAEAGRDDLILDVTVQRAFRGGSGLVQNANLATVDVKAVLSDGADNELIGSADIRGKSSGIVIGDKLPEEEAIDAVAASIGQILVASGCSGPRVARARPAPPRKEHPDVELIADQKSDAAVRAEAENEEGKRLFLAADVNAARTHFKAAIRLHRHPRYVFNLCLAEESLGSLDAAVSTCQSVMALKPDDALAEKVRLRLEILAKKRSSEQ